MHSFRMVIIFYATVCWKHDLPFYRGYSKEIARNVRIDFGLVNTVQTDDYRPLKVGPSVFFIWLQASGGQGVECDGLNENGAHTLIWSHIRRCGLVGGSVTGV